MYEAVDGGDRNGVVGYYLALFAERLVSGYFFFSSRRRHTRLTCDWSSDVCSSDLYLLPFYKMYLRVITPRIGKMLSGSLDAYKYLNESVIAFPEGEAFIGILNKSGFKNTYFKRLSLGICTIYCGRK